MSANQLSEQQPALPLPFSPSPGESQKAFQCFLCYFDLGQNRSAAKVAEAMQVSLGSVKLWARRYDWQDRIRAYNTLLLQSRVAVETAAAQDQAAVRQRRLADFLERESETAEKLLDVARRVLNSFLARTPSDISLAEVARALEIASKIGRLSLGLATDKTEHTGPDGGPFRLEVEAALKKIYGPAPAEILDVTPEPPPPALAGPPGPGGLPAATAADTSSPHSCPAAPAAPALAPGSTCNLQPATSNESAEAGIH